MTHTQSSPLTAPFPLQQDPTGKKFEFFLASRNLEYLGLIFACSQLLTFHQSFKLVISQIYPSPRPTAPCMTSHQDLPQNDCNSHPVDLLPPVYSILISLYLYFFSANPDAQVSVWKDKLNENGPFFFLPCCQSNIS